MPNLRGKTWTTTTPANVEDAQYWEDHLISDADAAKIGTVILPAGGTAGQVLTKQSSTANDATWEEPASSGHTIVDEDDTDMPYRTNLQFLNADVTDDSANDATVVDCKGSKGDPGQAATITVGTVTTLPAGSNATVTNSGTSSAAVFNFGIPKGADGSGAGDMLSSDYDADSTVLNAGGITSYVASQAYTLPTAASNVLGGVKVGTNLSIDANGVLSATDTNTDTLHDLTDVDISLPSNGQALLYNSTSGKWENGDVAGSAADITYDNTTSGLTANDVQEAIDEVDGNLDTLSGKAYKTDDSTETTIASDDLLPIYDTSATASKKITVANVVKATVSNPNLLDNPWFTINQRGQSSYKGSNKYGLDRWFSRTNALVEPKSYGFDITAEDDANCWIMQKFSRDIIANIKDGNFVVSVMDKYGNIVTAPFEYVDDTNEHVVAGLTLGNYSIAISYQNLDATISRIWVSITNGDTVSIRAIKLEAGAISTLALDTIPDYATELLKCQRYFQRIGGFSSAFANGWFTTASLAYLFTKLATPMRVTPTITMSGTVYVWSPTKQAASSYALTAINTSSYENNGLVILVFNTGGTETVGVNSLAQFRDTTSYIDLSADL